MMCRIGNKKEAIQVCDECYKRELEDEIRADERECAGERAAWLTPWRAGNPTYFSGGMKASLRTQ